MIALCGESHEELEATCATFVRIKPIQSDSSSSKAFILSSWIQKKLLCLFFDLWMSHLCHAKVLFLSWRSKSSWSVNKKTWRSLTSVRLTVRSSIFSKISCNIWKQSKASLLLWCFGLRTRTTVISKLRVTTSELSSQTKLSVISRAETETCFKVYLSWLIGSCISWLPSCRPWTSERWIPWLLITAPSSISSLQVSCPSRCLGPFRNFRNFRNSRNFRLKGFPHLGPRPLESSAASLHVYFPLAVIEG